ncbi:MAG: hypothetical protein ACK5QH_08960 [Rubrivivax sp.]|jgi:hypothetical protein
MSITLSAEELFAITGYQRPGDQLAELLDRGFYRARRSRATGQVILERAHYEAVCAGSQGRVDVPRLRPSLKAVA